MNPRKIKLFSFFIACISLYGYSYTVSAETTDLIGSNEHLVLKLRRDFEPRLVNAGADLDENHGKFLVNPIAFDQFIDSHVAPLLDIESTTRALLGRYLFDTSRKDQLDNLIAEVDRTIRRYASKGLTHYENQEFKVNDVVVNEAGDRGWVQIRMHSDLLPAIDFEFLIKLNSNLEWRIVDVRFKGITYVSLKKHSFREIIERESILALQNNLSKKNNAYFSDICLKTNTKGSKPC